LPAASVVAMAPRQRPVPWPSQRAKQRVVIVLLAAVVASSAWTSLARGGLQGGASPQAFVTLGGVLLFILKALLLIVGIVVGCLAALVLCGGGLVAASVKAAIERLDRGILGVDVTIRGLTVNIRRGFVEIQGLVVANAEGYSADYLLNVDRAVADVDVLALVTSRLREITVQRIIFSNVDVIWEKSGLRHSNVKEVVDFIHAGREQRASQTGETAAVREVAPREPRRTSNRKITLKRVLFQDIGVKMASHILHGAGMRLAIADIDYADFSVDHGSSVADDIASILLLSVLKTVVENTAGKSIGDHLF